MDDTSHPLPASEPTLGAPPLPAQDPPAPPPRAGLVLREEIGRGGMGVVYRGRDDSLRRDLAVKVLQDAQAELPALRQRFLEEAQIAGQLQHPGIVPVHEVGTLPDYRPYFTMKLVKGRTLADLLAKRGTLADELPRYVAIFESVCQTMAYAHSHGVIHRDLKSANVMVGAFAEVLVMDWGLAKILRDQDLPPRAAREEAAAPEPACSEEQSRTLVRTARQEDDSARTQAGAVLGTPSCMAPEQARGDVDRIDERADVFGLGAILCEILTGKPPYEGKGAEALLQAAGAELDSALGRLGKCGADAELVALARACLAEEARDRPCDAGQVAGAVASYRAGLAEKAHRAELAAATARQRQRGLAVASGLGALLCVAVAGGWVLVTQQQAAREQDRLKRKADLSSRAQSEMREAAALRGKDATAARDRLQRAQALLAEESGDEALAAEVRRLLVEADSELRDARLLKQLASAKAKFGATDPVTGNWGYASGVARLKEALAEWGVPPGKGAPADAAQRMRHLSEPARSLLVECLAIWAYYEAHAGVEFFGGEGPPRVSATVREGPAQRAGLHPGDSVQGLALGTASPWMDTTRWDAARLGYWLNAPGASLIRLRVAGAEEGASTRVVRLEKPAAMHWVLDVLDGADLSPWRRAARQADRIDGLREREEAIGRLAKELDPLAEPVWSQVALAYRLGGIGRPIQKLALLRRLARVAPGDFLAHTALARELARQGDPPREELVRHLFAALAVQPDSESARLNLAWALESEGRLEEGLAMLRAGVEARPRSAAMAWGMGMWHQKRNKLDEALPWYRKAASLPGMQASAWEGIGVVLSNKGAPSAAEQAFRKSIEADASFASPMLGLAGALEKQGKRREAIAVLRRAVLAFPGQRQLWTQLGMAMEKERNLVEAERCFRRATQFARDRGSSYAWLSLGAYLLRHGNPKEALAASGRATTLDPKNHWAWGLTAACLRYLGRDKEAAQAQKHGDSLKSK